MPLSKEQLPVRKLCSCNSVLCTPEEAKTAPDTELFGVVLLNSPSNGEADFAEYVRLFQLYRGGGGARPNGGAFPKKKKGDDTSPYFICADGAYAGLRRYCAAQAAKTKMKANAEDEEDEDDNTTGTTDGSALAAMRLCDVLIGDMDSLSPAQLRHVAVAAKAAADEVTANVTDSQAPKNDVPTAEAAESGPLYHDTVAAIPLSLLEVIRKRRADALQRRSDPDPAYNDTPVVLPIECQLTTDFMKSISLLERLRRLEQGNTEDLSLLEQEAYYDSHHNDEDQAEELIQACDGLLAFACAEADQQAQGDAQEMERCRRLLTEVTPSTSTTIRTRVLPNVAVFGALGGRIDHEIGTMAAVMCYARIFNLIVVNSYNALFACWPDGVTQLLMPPSATQFASLSRDIKGQLADAAKVEPYYCGIVPFGVLREMETTGYLWNIVKNRRGCYSDFTGVGHLRFAFDGIVSCCNKIASCLVTTDVRPTTCDTANPSWDPEAPSVNPPMLFMMSRPKFSRKVTTAT